MQDGIASDWDGTRPTAEERALAVRVGGYVGAHREHLAEAEEWVDREHSLDAMRARSAARMQKAREQEIAAGWHSEWGNIPREPEEIPVEFAPFRRTKATLDDVLENGGTWIDVHGIGFAEPYPDEAERRTLWARRAIYAYWLLTDPRSVTPVGPFALELIRDRTSVFPFLHADERKELARLVARALELEGPQEEQAERPDTVRTAIDDAKGRALRAQEMRTLRALEDAARVQRECAEASAAMTRRHEADVRRSLSEIGELVRTTAANDDAPAERNESAREAGDKPDPREAGLDDTAADTLRVLREAKIAGRGADTKAIRASLGTVVSDDAIQRAVDRLRRAGFTIDNPKNRSGYWLRD